MDPRTVPEPTMFDRPPVFWIDLLNFIRDETERCTPTVKIRTALDMLIRAELWANTVVNTMPRGSDGRDAWTEFADNAHDGANLVARLQ